MAITSQTYNGDGSTTVFTFTVPYIDAADVKARVDNVATTAFSVSGTSVTFTTAPPSGTNNIKIFRDTNNASIEANFQSGSALRAVDFNDNFTQLLYVTQESTDLSDTATTDAANAVATANSTVATANTANTNATAAVNTANIASSNASTALNTANSAATDASTALSTANAASTDASAAVTTANAATTTANAATTTANTASTNASTALSTANTASTNASSAITTAAAASSTANDALNSVNNVVPYTVVANVSSLPTSPSDGDRVEVSDSTNAQSSSNITGLPSSFSGGTGINLRLQYSSTTSSFVFVDYIVQDPDSRYALSDQNLNTTDNVTFAGVTSPLTGNVTGNVTGNITGNVTGSVTGNVTGNLTGDVTGDVTGNLTGDVTGNLTGNVTGNSSTATTLQTSRNIGGVAFNGSANIDLPGVNTAGNQDTSGNAATATALATARSINGTSFDGSANIVIGNIPQNSQTSAYTLVSADSGKHVNITTGGVTVPSGVFSTGDAVSIYNNSTANQTVTQGTSVTLRKAGSSTTGNRTLAQYGICTVLCVATNEFIITGVGLT